MARIHPWMSLILPLFLMTAACSSGTNAVLEEAAQPASDHAPPPAAEAEKILVPDVGMNNPPPAPPPQPLQLNPDSQDEWHVKASIDYSVPMNPDGSPAQSGTFFESNAPNAEWEWYSNTDDGWAVKGSINYDN